MSRQRRRIVNVRDQGATGDGMADDSAAIRVAIAACAKAGGGTVHFPPGTYRTGPLQLASHLTLHLEKGALLLFSDRFDDYPPRLVRWEGVVCHGYSPLIYGCELTDVGICGEGTIDGQGNAWWRHFKEQDIRHAARPVGKRHREFARLNRGVECTGSGGGGWKSQFLRPALMHLFECQHISIDGVTFRNSPFWNVHLAFCSDVRVRGTTFYNPPGAPNGDGLDLDSCSGVRVERCVFDVNDDCVCLKSGVDGEGRLLGRPTENVVIANCLMKRGHGGVVFGSDMSGGIRNVTVRDCVFLGSDRGIRMKSRRGRGGVIENVRVSGIRMRDVATPFAFNLYYHCTPEPPPAEVSDTRARPVDETTPVIRHVHFENIIAEKAHVAAGFLWGLPESPIEDIVFRNVAISSGRGPLKPGWPDSLYDWTPLAGAGFIMRFVRNIRCEKVRIRNREGPAFRIEAGEAINLT